MSSFIDARRAIGDDEGENMGIGVSLILIAVGAILRWAVTAGVTGVNIHTVGLVLLIIGVVGLILSLVMWSSLGAWYPGRVRQDRVVRRDDYDDRDDLAA